MAFDDGLGATTDIAANAPFTPAMLRELLDSQVLKGESVPDVEDPALKTLSDEMNKRWLWVQLRTVHWKPSQERSQRFASALETIHDTVLPELRQEIAQALGFAKGDGPEIQNRFLEAARILDWLSDAIDAVAGCPVLMRPGMLDPIKVQWSLYVNDIVAAFHQLLPGSAKASGYRFATVAIPFITGERPTYEAVATHLKRGR